MITRIFRVKITSELRTEFEQKFSSISVDIIQKQAALIDVSISQPSKWTPDEYLMISR